MNERPRPPHGVPVLTEEVDGSAKAFEALREVLPGLYARAAHEPVKEPYPSDPTEPLPERRPPAPAPERLPPAEDEPVVPQRDPPPAAPSTDPPPPPLRATEPRLAEPTRAGATGAALDEEALTQRILVEVQRQVDQVIEYRLREALTPILNRAGDALVRDARGELSRSLRDIVARAVGQELLRQRGR